MKRLSTLAWLACSSALVGCSTPGSIRAAPADAGRTFHLAQRCEEVQPLIEDALLELGFVIRSVARREACGVELIAARPLSAFSWGELVRVDVEPSNDEATLLRVVTRRVLHTNVAATGDWSRQIYLTVVRKLGKPPR